MRNETPREPDNSDLAAERMDWEGGDVSRARHAAERIIEHHTGLPGGPVAPPTGQEGAGDMINEGSPVGPAQGDLPPAA